ncbi:hypothetical protein BD413DRAFT_151369 [Trametes elegans]|nr:hypothetical protein BD413DRAFT_151369 [Trametes elegans]
MVARYDPTSCHHTGSSASARVHLQLLLSIMLSYIARMYRIHPRGNLTPEQHEKLDRMPQSLKDSELSEAQRRFVESQRRPSSLLPVSRRPKSSASILHRPRAGIGNRHATHIHDDLAYPEHKPLLFKFHVCSEVVAGTTKPTEMSGLASYMDSDPFGERATWTQRLDLFLPHIRQGYQLPDDTKPRWYYDLVTYEAYKEMYRKLSSEQVVASS